MLVFSLRCYEAAIPTGLPCMHKTAKNESARIIGRQRMSEPMDKREEVEREKSARRHTHEWYARHYGKLEDWARKVLPEPWRNQFFNCVANGSYHHSLDIGEPYVCKAGYKIVPTNYFRVDTAEGQLILDQTRRAEEAEAANQEKDAEIARLKHEYSKFSSLHDANPLSGLSGGGLNVLGDQPSMKVDDLAVKACRDAGWPNTEECRTQALAMMRTIQNQYVVYVEKGK